MAVSDGQVMNLPPMLNAYLATLTNNPLVGGGLPAPLVFMTDWTWGDGGPADGSASYALVERRGSLAIWNLTNFQARAYVPHLKDDGVLDLVFSDFDWNLRPTFLVLGCDEGSGRPGQNWQQPYADHLVFLTCSLPWKNNNARGEVYEYVLAVCSVTSLADSRAKWATLLDLLDPGTMPWVVEAPFLLEGDESTMESDPIYMTRGDM